MLLGAAIILFAAGIVVALAKPGDLGAKSPSGKAQATTTTIPSATTGSTATTATTAPTTPTTGSTATTPTTARPGSGLGQPGAAAAETTTAATGGESMIGAALVMLGVALALRRARARVGHG